MNTSEYRFYCRILLFWSGAVSDRLMDFVQDRINDEEGSDYIKYRALEAAALRNSVERAVSYARIALS